MPKRKTHEQFVKEVFNKYGEEYSVLGIYIKSRTKILIKHNLCGHQWDANPQDILRGYGCPKCGSDVNRKTTDQFKQEVFNLVGDEFIVLGEYVNAKTKIDLRHNKCGETIDIIPNDFLQGSRCRLCSNNNNKQKTTEEYKNEVYDLTNGEFELVSEYTKSYEEVKIKHLQCGYVDDVIPNNFKKKQSCPVCHGNHLTKEIFRLKFERKYGNEFELITDLNSIKDNIKIKHSICNSEYEYLPKYVLDNEIKCKLCEKEKLKQEEINTFKAKLNSISDGNIKLIGEYKRKDRNVTFINLDCNHEFKRTPNKILKNQSCPICIKHMEFVDKVKSISNNEYEVLSEFKGTSEIVIFKHNCGHEFDMRANNFIAGQRCPECGNRDKALSQEEFEERIKVQGNNEYIVISKYKNSNTKVILKHLICGNEYQVMPDKFYEGNRCPICAESKGEQAIRHWLESHNINFEAQKEYSNLIGIGGGHLSYDFYVPEHNLLIEYQGEQHESYTKGFHPTYNHFKKQKEHDRRKREYAVRHNIKLLEIWYWDFDNIEEILDNQVLNGTYLK